MCTLLLLLLTLSCATLCFASVYWYHSCDFDKYNKSDESLLLVQELIESPSAAWTAYTATITDSWEPIRIFVSTADLHDEKKYCTTNGEKIKDFMKIDVNCNSDYFFTDEKRKAIKQIVRSAVQMHITRLKVKPMKHGFKVPTLTGDFCSSFTVPESHTNRGVKNADMVLYVAPLTSESLFSQVIAASCAALNDGRPVVSGIAYRVYNAEADSFNVRVAAHHIAHALGFSYNVMSKNTGVKLTNKTSVRHKPHVTEVKGTNTVNAVREYFDCQTATGMELEDEMGDLKVVSHSHWERRNAQDDLMAPVVTKGRYSALTLTLFTDLGYYQGQMEKAEPMQWGYGTQCNFLENPCLVDGETAYPTMFCKESNMKKRYCDDTRALVVCPDFYLGDSPVPSYLKYFSNNKRRTLSFADNYPILMNDQATDCQIDVHNALPGIKGKYLLCFAKASESHNIPNHDNQNGLCVKVETNNKKEVEITYEGSNKVTCANGKATLGGNYNGVILECPTAEELRIEKEEKESILLQEIEDTNTQKEEVIHGKPPNSEDPQVVKSRADKVLKKTPPQKIIKPVVAENAKVEYPKKPKENPKEPEKKSETTPQGSNPTTNTKNPDDNNTGTSVGKKSNTTETIVTETSKSDGKASPEINVKPKGKKESTSEKIETTSNKLPNAGTIKDVNDGSSTQCILLSLTFIFAIITSNALLQ